MLSLGGPTSRKKYNIGQLDCQDPTLPEIRISTKTRLLTLETGE